MAFNNAVTPSAAYSFVYCCCISFHPGSHSLQVNEPALTDVSDSTPLQVNASGTYLQNNSRFPVWEFSIASKDNDITIQSIVLNRGNCLISMPGRGKNVNKRLGYGGNLTFTTPSNANFSKCKPLELTIGTNKGSFTYNW